MTRFSVDMYTFVGIGRKCDKEIDSSSELLKDSCYAPSTASYIVTLNYWEHLGKRPEWSEIM